MRALLDARSEAQAAHGLEMRTELRFGDVAQELARRLGEAPGQMLILGRRRIWRASPSASAALLRLPRMAGADRAPRRGRA